MNKKKSLEKSRKNNNKNNTSDTEDSAEDSYKSFISDASDLSSDIESDIDMEYDTCKQNHHINIGNWLGNWALIRLRGKKQFKYFVGQFIEVSQDVGESKQKSELTVKFCKRVGAENSFKWPDNEDIGVITEDDVVKVISAPKFITKNDRVISFTFNESFEGYIVN